MGVIYVLSAQPADKYSRLGELLDFVPMLSSLVHGVLYFVLAALLIRLLVRLRAPRTFRARVFVAVAPVLLAVVYGLTDEFHQGFVEGRDSNVADIIADTLGAGCAALASYVVPGWRDSSDGTG